jgi:hypothetical protein
VTSREAPAATIAGRAPDTSDIDTEVDGAPRKAAPTWYWLSGILVLQAVLVGRYVRNSWFFVDDFLFLRQGLDEPLSLDYLRLGLFEHFSPVHRFVDWAFIRTAGLNWTVAASILMLLAAGCTLSFFYMTSAIVRDGRRVLIITGVYAVSLFFVRNAVWWTGGIHLMLVTIATLVCIGGFARWLIDRRPSDLAISVAALAFALLTHEHGLLVIGYLVLLRALVLEPRITSWRTAVQAVRDDWYAWALYGFLTALAAANFLANYYAESTKPQAGDLFRYLWYAVAEGFFSTLFLVKVPEARIASPVVSGAIALVCGLAIVVASLVARRGAWRPWSVFFVSFLVGSLALGLNRTVQFGPTIGREPRYHMAVVALFLLCVAVAFDGPPRFSIPKARSSVAFALTILLGLTYLFAFARAAPRVAAMDWSVPRTEAFFDQLGQDLRTERRLGREPVIANEAMPEDIVPSFLAPFNRFDLALGLFDERLVVERGPTTHRVSPTGALVPVDVEVGDSSDLAAVWSSDNDRSCYVPPDGGGEVRFSDLQQDLADPMVVRIEFVADPGSFGSVTATDVDGTQRSRRFSLPAGVDTVDVFVDGTSNSELSVRLDDAAVCVSSVELAALVPEST